MTVSLHDVRLAAERLRGNILTTPCNYSRTLSGITGAEVYLKFENLQFTASFKERGALNKLLSLTPKQRQRGVIAMSAGNHAQGVAYLLGSWYEDANFTPRQLPVGWIEKLLEAGPIVEGKRKKFCNGAAVSIIVGGVTRILGTVVSHRRGKVRVKASIFGGDMEFDAREDVVEAAQ